MRRLLRGRIHKRPFVVTSAVLVIFLIAGIAMVLYLGFFRKTSDTYIVRTRNEATGSETRGLGLNVSSLPTPNLLLGASFESISTDRHYIVYEGEEDYVYLLQDASGERPYGDGSFVGGNVRVLSLDEQGKMVQKVASEIIEFSESQFAPKIRIEEVSEPDEDYISFVSLNDSVLVFSSSGRYINDFATASRRYFSLPVSSQIICASDSGKRVNVLCDDWTVFTSTDGRNFSSFPNEDPPGPDPRSVTSVGRVVVACGDEGTVVTYCDGEMISVATVTDADLIASAGDGRTLLLIGNDGVMMTSSNGVIFRPLEETEKPFRDRSVDWVCATYSGGKYYAIGSKGEFAEGVYDTETGLFRFSGYLASAAFGGEFKPRSLIVDSFGEVLILTESGKPYVLSRDALKWKELSTGSVAAVDAFGKTPDGKIFLLQDGNFFFTRILSRVKYGERTSGSVANAGDMCFLSSFTPVFDGQSKESYDGLWQIFGEGANAQIAQDAPTMGGQCSLKIYSEDPNKTEVPRFVSQIITEKGSDTFSEKTFYRVEMWLKHNGMSDKEAMVWISGEFESVGTVFSDIGNNWRHYSALFVLPREACSENSGEVRLNIGFSGKGELFIDKVYFGMDSYSSEAIPDEYLNVIRDMHPVYLRLSNIPFGRENVSSDSFYYPVGNEVGKKKDGEGFVSAGCISLEASLRAARYAKANPWLIIDSSVSQIQIESLLEYLCGSISDPYGQMRIDNGTAVPWSFQFERIVFEITDPSDVYRTDLQRGAYVDYIIGIMKSSTHYLDIKDRILFLDGMNYSGGSMLSVADYHSSGMRIEAIVGDSGIDDTSMYSEWIANGYLDYYDRIPRILSRPQEKVGEWVGSADFVAIREKSGQIPVDRSITPVSAATYVEFLLHDYGKRTSVLCLDLSGEWILSEMEHRNAPGRKDLSKNESQIISDNSMTFYSVLATLNQTISGIPQQIETSPPISENNRNEGHSESEPQEDTLTAFAFLDGDRWSAVVLNNGEQTRQFRFESEINIEELIVDHYSESGARIGSSQRRRLSNVFTLLPGQYVVVQGFIRGV